MDTIQSGTFNVKRPKTTKHSLPHLQRRLIDSYQLFILFLPALIYYIVFQYLPIYGVQIAFKDFNIIKGITGSPWVGFHYFERFIISPDFPLVMRNTLLIGVFTLALAFPAPIILALLLNSTTSRRYKNVIQTVTYAPYFISTIVLVSLMYQMLSPTYGVVNQLIQMLGFEKIYFMGQAKYFYSLYAISQVWQYAGYSSLIYVAALTSINPELHEAAMADGANRLNRIWHIDLPGITPTVITMLILNAGNVLSAGFAKSYAMQNPLNISTGQVITTFVYQRAIQFGEISYGSAIGLFNTVINFIILITVSKIAKKYSEISMW